MNKLEPKQRQWVEKTLASMSMENRVAQILIPTVEGGYARMRDFLEFMENHALGGVFVSQGAASEHKEGISKLQQNSEIPLVVAADLECGSGHVVDGHVRFPTPLAVAAADDEKLAYTVGKAAAIEGRSIGVHWTYAPVVDVNLNPDNPIACNRSMGDDPERVARLASAVTRGMQDHGLAACAKHFPGDGVDDLDQHVVTSVNSLSMDRWRETFGTTFGAVFEAGALSVMIGHIAFPAMDGQIDRRGAYCPGTVSRKIVTDLLRGEMGFEGMIVTDDMNMGGVAGYMNKKDRTVACVNAGCDMVLFPHIPEDYSLLVSAVESGEISEERITDAARRVLEFKARLNLHEGKLFGEEATPAEVTEFAKASQRISESAICCVRDLDGLLPLKNLAPGARVMTVTISDDGLELPEIDKALEERGYKVDHLGNPEDWTISRRMESYDAIFLNFAFLVSWGRNSIRSVGVQNRIFLGGFITEHPCVVTTSFGSPYHLRTFGTLLNYINIHADCLESQRAAVAAWFGELPMNATSPVSNLQRRLA